MYLLLLLIIIVILYWFYYYTPNENYRSCCWNGCDNCKKNDIGKKDIVSNNPFLQVF